jgi:hypothetical protein
LAECFRAGLFKSGHCRVNYFQGSLDLFPGNDRWRRQANDMIRQPRNRWPQLNGIINHPDSEGWLDCQIDFLRRVLKF